MGWADVPNPWAEVHYQAEEPDCANGGQVWAKVSSSATHRELSPPLPTGPSSQKSWRPLT